MYFTQQSFGIRRANLDGSNLAVIKSNGADPEGLTLDVPNQRIYYVEQDIMQVRRINFDGSNDTLLFTDSTSLNDIAIDTTNSKLYWTSGTNGGSNGTITCTIRSPISQHRQTAPSTGLTWTAAASHH